MKLKPVALASALIISGVFVLPAGMVSAAGEKTGAEKKVSSSDANFIKEATQGGIMEVRLGKLASEKASNNQVKEFGRRMEQDHSKVNDELKKLASDKGVEVQTELDTKHKSTVDRLTKLSGAEFDRQYMEAMVKDHKEDISKFQSEAEKAKDADVKKFASQTLPTLKEHLQLAQSAAQQVKGSAKSSSR
jgi:putative membrane protein